MDRSRAHLSVANHQSIVDVLALIRTLPVPLLCLLGEELRRVALLGWYAAVTGMISLPRRRSLPHLRRCAPAIDRGYSAPMLPEGSRSHGRRRGPFKPGTFLPAIDAGVEVVPVLVEGTRRLLLPGGFRLGGGPIRMVVGQPLGTAGLSPDDRPVLADQIRE